MTALRIGLCVFASCASFAACMPEGSAPPETPRARTMAPEPAPAPSPVAAATDAPRKLLSGNVDTCLVQRNVAKNNERVVRVAHRAPGKDHFELFLPESSDWQFECESENLDQPFTAFSPVLDLMVKVFHSTPVDRTLEAPRAAIQASGDNMIRAWGKADGAMVVSDSTTQLGSGRWMRALQMDCPVRHRGCVFPGSMLMVAEKRAEHTSIFYVQTGPDTPPGAGSQLIARFTADRPLGR